MAQFYQIVQSDDDLKRFYPNLTFENVQLVSMGGEDIQFGATTAQPQQVILTQDQNGSLIINEQQLQQLVYQSAANQLQNTTGNGQTHLYIQEDKIQQQTSDVQADFGAQTSGQQIFFTTELPTTDTNSHVIAASQQQAQSQSQSQLQQQHQLIEVNTGQGKQQQQSSQLQQPQQQSQLLIQQIPQSQILVQGTQQSTTQQQQQIITVQQQAVPQTARPPTSAVAQHHVVLQQSPTQVVLHHTPGQTATNHILFGSSPPRLVFDTTSPQQQRTIVHQIPQLQQHQPQRIITTQQRTVQQTMRPPNQLSSQPPQLKMFDRVVQGTQQQTLPTQTRFIITQAADNSQQLLVTTSPQTTTTQRLVIATHEMTTTSTPPQRERFASPRISLHTNLSRGVPQAIIRPQMRVQQHARPNAPMPMCRTPQLTKTRAIIHQTSPAQSQYNQIFLQQARAASTPVQRYTITTQHKHLAIQSPTSQFATNQLQKQQFVARAAIRKPQTTKIFNSAGQTVGIKIDSSDLADDLEESIAAVVVTKSSVPSQRTPCASVQNVFNNISPDDDNKIVTLNSGHTMSLSAFREITRQQHEQQHQQQLDQQQQQNNRLQSPQTPLANRTGTVTTPQLTLATKKRIDNAQISGQQQLTNPTPPPVIPCIVDAPEPEPRESAKMLVILASGEQRLITFTLPKESCTVQELLEQVGVPFTSDTNIQCVSNPGANIDYVVTVGVPVQETTTDTVELLNAANEKPKSKFIAGMLAVCKFCGYSGQDFTKCQRCMRVFSEEPRRVPNKSKLILEKEGKDKNDHEQHGGIQLPPSSAGHVTRHQICLDGLNRVPANSVANLRGILRKSGQHYGGASTGGASSVASQTSRGQRISRPRTKIVVEPVEPVILTLSSDDDEEKEKKSAKSRVPALPFSEAAGPLPCEPIITEHDIVPADFNRENVTDLQNSVDKLYTSVSCRTIRIGSYKYEPTEKVTFSSKGVRIIAPNVKNHADNVILDIQLSEIIKLVAHFPNALSVLFLYTIPSCGIYIRESLDMPSSKINGEPFYNPLCGNESAKRIILLMDQLSDDSRSVIQTIFSTSVLDSITIHDANQLLIRSSAKDVPSTTNSIKQSASDSEDIRQILIYPQGTGGISINTEDYMCLGIDQYLNDVIIDFYLQYLRLEIMSDEQREKTHIFSSFFYNRLTTMSTRQRAAEKELKLSAAQKRHARVKSWTKNVNLFDKDFIVIPINEQSHWFLAIICFAALKGPMTMDSNVPVQILPVTKKKSERKLLPVQIGNTTITKVSKREDAICLGDDSLSERDEAEGDDSDLASENEADGEPDLSLSIKQPCVLIFDSLAGASRSRVVATLRDYLTCEYKAKVSESVPHIFDKTNIPGHCVKVPQQNNFTDCGLYLLQYVEQFFRQPIPDYRLPIRELTDWFDTIIVTRKREEISNLLKELIAKSNSDQSPLPNIVFPTLNGKLVDVDESLTEEQAEFEEEDMEEEEVDEDEFAEDEEAIQSSFSSETTNEELANVEKQLNGRRATLKRVVHPSSALEISRKNLRRNES